MQWEWRGCEHQNCLYRATRNRSLTVVRFSWRACTRLGEKVKKHSGRIWAAAIFACLVAMTPAGAAVVKTSFSVSATVVATCRIVPGQANPCAPMAAQQDPAIGAVTPVVTYSHDSKTGTVIETLEF
jgi:hypothetical protein